MHKVYFEQRGGDFVSPEDRKLIKSAVLLTLELELVDKGCDVCVLITDDLGIQSYNLEYRGKDKATDVLSFPIQEFSFPGWGGVVNMDIDLVSGQVLLGDIIISTETIARQAEELSHSVKHETTLMVIHSTLHLLGYDHLDDESEIDMRTREVKVLGELYDKHNK